MMQVKAKINPVSRNPLQIVQEFYELNDLKDELKDRQRKAAELRRRLLMNRKEETKAEERMTELAKKFK